MYDFSDITSPASVLWNVTWALTDHEEKIKSDKAKIRGLSVAVLEEPKIVAFCAFHCLN